MSAPKTVTSRPLRPLLSWRLWLCAAMLFVQTLGMVHGLSHGLPAVRQALVLPAQAQSGQPGQPGARLGSSDLQLADAVQAQDLFAGHQDSIKCRLLDHLADQGAPAPVLVHLEPVTQTPLRSDFRDERLATRLIAAFQARGPPTST